MGARLILLQSLAALAPQALEAAGWQGFRVLELRASNGGDRDTVSFYRSVTMHKRLVSPPRDRETVVENVSG